MLKDLIRVLKGELSSQQVENLQTRLAKWEEIGVNYTDSNLRLIATIRDMDQIIWTMGQQPSWERMRSHFLDLQSGMEERKQIENARIRTLMTGEIIQAYNTHPEKLIQGPNLTATEVRNRIQGKS